jgi:hypothetical protein
MAENAARAVRGKRLRFGSKRLPPPGLLTEGQTRCMIYSEVSNTVNFKSILAKIEGIESGKVLSRGNGLDDHDHPIPR